MVTKDHLEAFHGDQLHTVIENVQARLKDDNSRLTKAVYHVKGTSPWLPKPKPTGKTCTPAAHTQQVGLEECLLQWSGKTCIHDLAVLTKSWTCDLVHTVADSATDLENPVVLISEKRSRAWLIIASLGRCLLGWPLKVADAAIDAAETAVDAAGGAAPDQEPGFLYPVVPMTVHDLSRIIITDPCSATHYRAF